MILYLGTNIQFSTSEFGIAECADGVQTPSGFKVSHEMEPIGYNQLGVAAQVLPDTTRCFFVVPLEALCDTTSCSSHLKSMRAREKDSEREREREREIERNKAKHEINKKHNTGMNETNERNKCMIQSMN